MTRRFSRTIDFLYAWRFLIIGVGLYIALIAILSVMAGQIEWYTFVGASVYVAMRVMMEEHRRRYWWPRYHFYRKHYAGDDLAPNQRHVGAGVIAEYHVYDEDHILAKMAASDLVEREQITTLREVYANVLPADDPLNKKPHWSRRIFVSLGQTPRSSDWLPPMEKERKWLRN